MTDETQIFNDLIMDGANGTLFFDRENLGAGYPPELLNLERPDTVFQAHCDYIAAGANVISINTFGANPFKTERYAEYIDAATGIALKAANGRALTAFDIGPTGKLFDDGFGFEALIDAFKSVVTAGRDRADFIYLETFTDLRELRAAVIAAKECSCLPVVASMSFSKNERTPFGNPADSFVYTAIAAGADAVGANCSLGPKEMLGIAKTLAEISPVPVFIQPNAGMPRIQNGKTVYDVNPHEFACCALEFKKLGIEVVGGCCGTTPEYISATAKILENQTFVKRGVKPVGVVASAMKTVLSDGLKIVGERINPTGKKFFRDALLCGDFDYPVACGIEQEETGAEILDVNVGVNGLDETATMSEVVKRLCRVTDAPLQIDTSNPQTLSKTLREYCGKAIVNSVNGTRNSLSSVLPLAAKYGAAVIGLTIDDNGIPKTAAERVGIAERIIEECRRCGIQKQDIYIDTLTLSEASGAGNALVTLDALEAVKKLGVKTVLGISNVSFGMPQRNDINAAFLDLAKARGLDLAIINPALLSIKPSQYAYDFLNETPDAAQRYIDFAQHRDFKDNAFSACVTADLKTAVETGQKELAARLAQKLLSENKNADISAAFVIPALDKIGADYENGKIFLPQLIASADAAKAALNVILKASGDGLKSGDRFVVATVKGDVHDIGKNIVKAVAANYGFDVIDLGKDVAPDKILAAVEKYYPCVLGLSALMTTTVDNMEAALRLVKERFDIPVLVGGAVLTPEYAEHIGGVYCADASATVKKLKEIFKTESV